MKHKLQSILFLILILLLTSCSVSQSDSNVQLNKNSESTSNIESLSEYTTPETELESTQTPLSVKDPITTNQPSELDELQVRAKAKAETAITITSGSLYDTVTSIFNNVLLTSTADGSLCILFTFDQSTAEETAIKFFDIAEQICKSYSIEKEYSSITFMLKTDEGLLAALTLLDYEASDSFTSGFTVFEHEYETAFTSAYNNSSLNNDISDSFNTSLQQQYAKVWATSAFGENSICFTDENKSYFQCLSGKTYSISNDGISELWSDFINSMAILGYMYREYPGSITYETISVKFFDPSDTYILDIVIKHQNNSYSLDSIVCNMYYVDKILSVLTSAMNK